MEYINVHFKDCCCMEYQELTEKIIGCAFDVYNTIGYGFLESVYEKSLLIELRNAGFTAESQVPISVEYKGSAVGDFVADVVVNDEIILELKSVTGIAKIHELQLVNYLVATGKPLGLLINFGPKKVEVKRRDLAYLKRMTS